MLSVIFIWVYMILTAFLVGYGVLRFLTRHLAYITPKCSKNPAENKSADLGGNSDCAVAGGWSPAAYGVDAYIMCGLVCVTVYAQFFSLFAGVGLWANVVLCVVCFGIFLHERKGIFEVIQSRLLLSGVCGRRKAGGADDGNTAELYAGICGKSERMFRTVKWVAVTALFFLFAYGTSRGIPHYDTALYHAQSIRWIEEYGVVKGLGNLHCRLAYNSSSFALSALYSMAFLGGRSFHCAAGFLAFVLAAGCLRLADSIRERKLRTSDFARVMCVYYLVNIFDEMISPASDYFMVLIAFYLVITWLSLAERGEKEIFPYALLCVLAVFLLTVKLSAALILLLTIYPACRLVKEKQWGQTGIYLGLGFVTALPFLIRNVLLSGWLVYPFTRIDLFDVIWKIPKGVADYDAREIQVWGRGYSDVARYDIQPHEWQPDWFHGLAGSDKVFVIAALLAIMALFVWGWYYLWWCSFFGWPLTRLRKGSAAYDSVKFPPAYTPLGRRVSFARLTAQCTVALSFLFWLGTSPLMRYGCVYVYLTPAVVFGGIYAAIMEAGQQTSEVGSRKRKAPPVGERVEQEEGKGISDSKAGNKETGRHQIVGFSVCTAVLLLLAYKAFALGRGIAASYENDHWILQKDYENFEVESCEIEGVTFYYPVQGDQTGYDAFPSAPAIPRIAFLGDGLADGFRAADSNERCHRIGLPKRKSKPL